MLALNIIFSVYGILLVFGGYMGFKKAGSKVSLIMGILSGGFIFTGIFLARESLNCGLTIIAATSGILLIVFLKRLIKTKKVMPAGMLLLITVLMLILSLIQLIKI
ncbi:MAG: TMEM14 family protein [Candidatus Omnitrophica bacterium]|nr:TMEM14 family protein [Candidatus Omnitrophota bacterium]MCB9748123.1 TMEM14 family protein [Candidatus Omnitrophota bacterium]